MVDIILKFHPCLQVLMPLGEVFNLHKVRVLVACQHKVVRDGVALIFNAAENLEVVGCDGAGVLKEAVELQPDLLIYSLHSAGNDEYEELKELKGQCGWTKIIVFTTRPLSSDITKRFCSVCSGYVQGPILPGFLVKAVELAYHAGYFVFLSSQMDIKTETFKEDAHGSRLLINDLKQ